MRLSLTICEAVYASWSAQRFSLLTLELLRSQYVLLVLVKRLPDEYGGRLQPPTAASDRSYWLFYHMGPSERQNRVGDPFFLKSAQPNAILHRLCSRSSRSSRENLESWIRR
jgi:hypothetical protein